MVPSSLFLFPLFCPRQLLYADLTAATDLLPHNLVCVMWEGLIHGLGLPI